MTETRTQQKTREADIIVGDNRELMADMPAGHFHCVVTSPPYFGLRDYQGDEREIGKEATPDEFVQAMRSVFGGRDNPVGVWRVLRDDGVLWVNLGDSYNAYNGNRGPSASLNRYSHNVMPSIGGGAGLTTSSLKPKDLIGIPWRVALALQADGYFLRDAIIWHKPAPMPGSQRDRCTSSYEFIFQLTKSPRYFFDLEAVKEPIVKGDCGSSFTKGKTNATHPNVGKGPRFGGTHHGAVDNRAYSGNEYTPTGLRTPRNVWKIAHEGFNDAHFATYPQELPTRCIKASTSERGCCGVCGAPVARVVERKRKATRPGKANVSDDSGKANRDEQRHVTETKTTGWEATCECDAATVNCRVLDPFNGAGTTGVAASLLGRDYVGCELNPAYAAMSVERIKKATKPSTARTDAVLASPLFGISPDPAPTNGGQA